MAGEARFNGRCAQKMHGYDATTVLMSGGFPVARLQLYEVRNKNYVSFPANWPALFFLCCKRYLHGIKCVAADTRRPFSTSVEIPFKTIDTNEVYRHLEDENLYLSTRTILSFGHSTAIAGEFSSPMGKLRAQ